MADRTLLRFEFQPRPAAPCAGAGGGGDRRHLCFGGRRDRGVQAAPQPGGVGLDHLAALGCIRCALGIITVAPLVIGLASALRKPPPRSELIEGTVALAALVA